MILYLCKYIASALCALRFSGITRKTYLENTNVRKLGAECSNMLRTRAARMLVRSPPRNHSKNMLLQTATARITQKNTNISLEVSSSLFVLQHLCTNIKISIHGISISRRRLKTSLNIAKPTFHETIKTAADQ